LGTAGGLDIHRSDGTVQYITEIAGQSLYGITGLAEDQDGNIWISSGASFDGTYCWNRASWTYYKIGDFPGGVRIHKIRKDRSGKLWFLGISNDFPEHSIAEPGAFCFDDGRFVRWGVREGMVHGRVYSFAQGCDGAMWFGTWRGISRWKEGKWTTLTTRQGLRGDKIFTLAVDSSNRVWFGNRGNGLGYFDEELRPHYLTTTDGLVNDDVWDLNVDSHGTLWISTSGGVASLRDGVFSRFDTKAGLIQAQVWPILPSDESVYIGTKGNGLDILNLKADAPLPVRIYPEKPITDAGNALLRWRVLSFWGEQPSDIIQVRYRLGDEPWTDWTAAREVTMDKLAPGEYAFTIEAANLFGSLNNSTEKVLFNIAFPLYRRPVFLVPVVALTLAVVFLGMNQAFRKRKHASALRESEAKFRRLTEATFEGIAIHDNGTMIDANPSILKIFGYELGEFVGKSALEFTAPESHEAVATNMVSENDEPYEAIGIRKDGSRIAVEIIGKMIPYDGRNLRVVAVRDITARKQAEAKLLSYQSQLRSLASEVSMSEERERRRMAEYLHNYIGQTLALCKIKLGTPPESASDESRKRHTDEIRALLDQMIHDTQSLTFDLSPPVLYELGFEDAIEWLTDQMQGQHNTVFSFQTDGQPKPLGSDIRVLLFHAVRELLVNTVKHAKAQEVTVSLERQDSQIIIRVEDDGTGFDRAADRSRDSKGGFGLFNIRERIAYFGGRMDIESGNGFGTRVTLSAPLEQTTMPQRRPEQ
jgi:PAS domain S-box-containing protein